MDASTLTRHLKPLVTAGWVEVRPGPDARSRLIVLTQAGRAKRAQAQQRWRAAQDGLQRRVGLARVGALHALLDDTLAAFGPGQAGHTGQG